MSQSQSSVAKRRFTATTGRATKRFKSTEKKTTAKIPTSVRLYAPARKAEIKHGLIVNTITADNNGVITNFGRLGQGSSDHERVGGLVFHLKLQHRANITAVSAATAVRVIVGMWTQALAATPVVSDILEIAAGSHPYFLSPYNADRGTAYKILSDDTFDLNTPGALVGTTPTFVPVTRSFQRESKIGRTQEYYASGTSDVVNWDYFQLCVSNNASNVVTYSQFEWTFTDV